MYKRKRLRKKPALERGLLGDHSSSGPDVRLGARHRDGGRVPVCSVLSWAAVAEGSLPLVHRDFTLGSVVGLTDLHPMHGRLGVNSTVRPEEASHETHLDDNRS